MAVAHGVNGPISAQDLGLTLPHEHLLLDMSVRYLPHPDEGAIAEQPRLEDRWRMLSDPAGYRENLQGTDIGSAMFEVSQFQAAGGRTIVDLTAEGLHPDPSGLRDIALSLDINVISGTGYYIAQSLPGWVLSASVTDLAHKLIDDIATGGDAGVPRGAIGEIALESGQDIEFACIAAAARAQSETGAPVFMHVMSGILPAFRTMTEDALALFVREGGDLEKLVLCHQDGSGADVEYQQSLLDKGIILEYDTFGSEGVFAFGKDYIQLPTDSQRMHELRALFDLGYGHRLLISQDICYQSSKRAWGGGGFAHIIEVLYPRFATIGFGEEDLRMLMVTNPASVFAFA